MDVTLILKVAGCGLLVSLAHQVLSKSGRDEQAMFVTIAGIVIVLMLLTGEVGQLMSTIRSTFGI